MCGGCGTKHEIDETTNILLNLQSGLSPDNLSEKEIKLLIAEFGQDWKTKLGY